MIKRGWVTILVFHTLSYFDGRHHVARAFCPVLDSVARTEPARP